MDNEDPLEAESEQQAIYVSEYNGQVSAVGDETKEEWILAEQCYSLEWMR